MLPSEAYHLFKCQSRIATEYKAVFDDLNSLNIEGLFLKLKTLAPRIVDGYDLLCVLYYRNERYDLALENLEQARAIKPSYFNYSNLGTIYFLYERDYKKAKEMFLEASKLDQNNYTVKGNLADACLYLGEIENASSYYRQAIQLAEKELKVRSKDAKAYSQVGRYYALVGEKRNQYFHHRDRA